MKKYFFLFSFALSSALSWTVLCTTPVLGSTDLSATVALNPVQSVIFAAAKVQQTKQTWTASIQTPEPNAVAHETTASAPPMESLCVEENRTGKTTKSSLISPNRQQPTDKSSQSNPQASALQFQAKANGPAGPLQLLSQRMNSGWIQMESGSRPVYVGIHGGTVPLSLVRASNGILFAFAGQTGNDFMQVLQKNTNGGGKNSSNANAETQKIAQATPESLENSILPAEVPQDDACQSSLETKRLKKQAEDHKSSQSSSISPSEYKRTVEAPVLAALAPTNSFTQQENKTEGTDDIQRRLGYTPPTAQNNKTAASQLEIADGRKITVDGSKADREMTRGSNAPLPQKSESRPLPLSEAKPNPLLDHYLDNHSNEQGPIIASSNLASRLTQSPTVLSPYGLSAEDSRSEEALFEEAPQTTSPEPTKAFPVLKLGSYKKIINQP